LTVSAAVIRSRLKSIRAVALMLLVVAPCAAAQSGCLRTDTARTPTPDGNAAVATPDGNAAVVILAAVSAREVHFNKQPTLHVRLCGDLDSVHVLDRRNLPSPVVTGTTYQNVYIAVEIFGRMNADCIAKQLTNRGAAFDCAALDVRGATTTSRPPADTTRLPRR
jgi:hypothetical protein